MRVCGECKKPLEGSATRCVYCGSATVSYVADKKPEAPTEEESGGITIIFDKGQDHPHAHKHGAEGTGPGEAAGEQDEIEEETSPLIQKVLLWAKEPKYWIIAGAVIVALGGLAWWTLVPHKVQVQEVEADPRAVDPVLAKDFSKIVDAAIPDKLEWGRDMMKRRVPTRFPEELIMDVDRDNPEVRYNDDTKTTAYYRFIIAYHFKETHKKLYPWTSVTFFFELRKGKWVLTGERWPRESEVVFE
jgi:hypothetical protein